MAFNDEDLQQLIARCALRDQAALRQLYEASCAYLKAVTYRILRSDQDAEEVLQEAYVQIWQNAASYRPELAKPLTWMASIARYRALDRSDGDRRRQRTITPFDEDSDALALRCSDDHAPEVALEQRDTRRHILDCLSQLNQQIRQSIALAYLEGYSREEVALALNSNVNTVKSWLHRGAERLKRCLEMKQ